MKIAILILALAGFCVAADSTAVSKGDTVWQKVVMKDTAVSTQTKYVPVVLPAAVQPKPKSRMPNYIIGGSMMLLGVTAGALAIENSTETQQEIEIFGEAHNTRTYCIYISLSLAAILAGVAEIVR
jgi:hypothetical protein